MVRRNKYRNNKTTNHSTLTKVCAASEFLTRWAVRGAQFKH